jgi:hypothetical protein
MRPPFSASEFIRRAREAQHDSLAIESDVEATVTLSNVARARHLAQPSLATLALWESLVDEVESRIGEQPDEAAAMRRWLAVESIRLGTAKKLLGCLDDRAHERSGRWAIHLSVEERQDIVRGVQVEHLRVTTATATSKG